MKKIKRIISLIRFGRIRESVICIDGGTASEIMYQDRFRRIVGYWAYGYYDPSMPYKGEQE